MDMAWCARVLHGSACGYSRGWVAQYYDREMDLWFDIGDPLPTRADAVARANTWMRGADVDPSCGDEQLAGNYRPFCGFKCWNDYVTTVVAPDVDRDEPTCPTCGAES